MKTSSVAGLSVLLFSIAGIYACSAQPQDTRPVRPGGSAGASASGGTGGSGVGAYAGTINYGGNSGTGTAGIYGTAGSATAGAAGTYGTAGAGTAGAGTAGAGVAGAGTAGAGTAGAGTGGAGAAGAAGAGTAGAGTAGTGAVACETTFTVGTGGFVRAPASAGGCWHGYAFVGADTKSTASPKDFSTCTATCPLTLTGSVAAGDASYAFLGFNVNQASTGGTAAAVTPTGAGLVVSWTGSFTGLRIQLNADATGTLFWCAPLPATGPATIPYASLMTQCWGTTGTAYAKQPIIAVELSLPGSTAAQAANLTLTSITEN